MTDPAALDDVALLHQAEEAWRSAEGVGLAAALQALGLGADPAAAAQLVAALAKANGRRQDHRVEPRDLIAALVAARLERAPSVRVPDPQGTRWLRRDARQTWYAIQRHEGAVQLTLGTEAISSWSRPRDPQALLDLTLPDVAPRDPDTAPAPSTPAPVEDADADALPLDLYTRLDGALFERRGDYALKAAAAALNENLDHPAYPRALALVESYMACWDDAERASTLHLAGDRQLLASPCGHLLRQLHASPDELRALTQDHPETLPHLATITRLHLRNPPDLAADRDLLAPFASLQHLHIDYFSGSPKGAAWFAEALLPTSLQSLELAAPPADAFEAFAARLHPLPLLRDLHTVATTDPLPGHRLPPPLRLTLRVRFEPELIRVIDQGLQGAPLHGVELITSEHRAEALLRAAAAAEFAPTLRALHADLPPGAPAYLTPPTPWRLQRLSLVVFGSTHRRTYGRKPEQIAFSPEDLRLLTHHLHPADLQTLRLSGTLNSPHAALLAAALRGAPLTHISLHTSQLGNDGLRAFAQAGLLASLTTLSLTEAKLQADGLLALLQPSPPPDLLHLILNENSISQRVAEALAAWPGLARLRTLSLQDARITPRAKETLLASPHLRRGCLIA